MYPQSELDNYKLQVDLLQEKLKRSEENRQQLEQELKQLLHKRSEHDKAMRAKQRQKYQSFLDEQKRRNERNQLLLQMLERIDQQTAALTARSERLKMMKLQYERYFAKLVQTQPVRCLPDAASPVIATTTTPIAAPIPVLVPATPVTAPIAAPAAAFATLAPIKDNQQPPSAATTETLRPAATESTTTTTPATIAVANNEVLTPRMWTLAMATPTAAGLVLTSGTAAPPTTTTIAPPPAAATTLLQPEYLTNSGNSYDYLQYPYGCVPLMQQQQQQQQQLLRQQHQQQQLLLQQQQQQQLQQSVATLFARRGSELLPTDHNAADTDRPTALQAYDKLQQALSDVAANKTAADLAATQYDNGAETTTATTTPATPTTPTTTTRQENEQLLSAADNSNNNSSSTSPTPGATTTALTFDKLPRTLTDVDERAAVAVAVAAAAPHRNDSEAEEKKDYEKAWTVMGEQPPYSTTATAENVLPFTNFDKSRSEPIASAAGQPARRQQHVEIRRHSKTIEPSNALLSDASPAGFSDRFDEIPTNAKLNAGNMPNTSNMAPQQASAEATPEAEATMPQQQLQQPIAATTTKLSIENIENAIYGELVNPDDDKPLDAQNYFSELLDGQQQKVQEQDPIGHTQQKEQQEMSTARDSNAPADYANYATTYGSSGEPTATDDTTSSVSEAVSSYQPDESSAGYGPNYGTTNAEVYPTEAESAYATADNYEVDQTQQAQQQQQDAQPENYGQLDYGNYDAAQYGNYDPNAYPGYTYNEATGEYTADPAYSEQQQQQQYNEQYNEQQQYAEQQYGEQQQQEYAEQQQYEDSQPAEQANYDYAEYAQQQQQQQQSGSGTTENIAEAMTNEAAAPTPATAATSVDNTNNSEPSAAAAELPKVLKPTSILSNADKHAAANDAQKKKKRVNFVDSSETDDSSSAKPAGGSKETAGGGGGAPSSESDFDFSSSGEAPVGN